jgi:squalene synthase HpnD
MSLTGGIACEPERDPTAGSPAAGPDPKRHVEDVVRRSGTSFFWGMRLLPKPKREAMFAIYAFCREVDDVADGDLPAARKAAELGRWGEEIEALFAGRPTRPTTRALRQPVARFTLPEAEFRAMIDGMAMDAGQSVAVPDMATLERYCRCVAGAVGLLSIRVFGARSPRADGGAVALGEALQLTNIVRDIAEDAALGRLYLPAELLDRHGIQTRVPEDVVVHPALPAVAGDLADRAERRFSEAEAWLDEENRRDLRPALIMMHVYRAQLRAVRAAGWRDPHRMVRPGKLRRLGIALRHGFF